MEYKETADAPSKSAWHVDPASISYFFCTIDGKVIQNKNKINSLNIVDKKCGVTKKGNIIKMELNLTKGTMTIHVNEKCLGIAVQNIEKGETIKYKLAVTLCLKNSLLSLENFEYL